MFGIIAGIALKLAGGLLGFAQKHVDATTERLKIDALREQNEANATNAASEISSRTVIALKDAWVPKAIVLPFIVHLWLVAADTILTGFGYGQWFEVPAFPDPFDKHGWKILLSYFGLSGAVAGASIIGGALARRK